MPETYTGMARCICVYHTRIFQSQSVANTNVHVKVGPVVAHCHNGNPSLRNHHDLARKMTSQQGRKTSERTSENSSGE